MKILVLEDTTERVSWLRSVVGSHADIVYSDNVIEFVELSKTIDEADLAAVILDHDLPLNVSKPKGTISTETHLGDRNGNTGADAAKRMRVFADVPHLVWSCNDTGSQNILSTLHHREVTDATHVPYYERNHAAIVHFVIRSLKLFKAKRG